MFHKLLLMLAITGAAMAQSATTTTYTGTLTDLAQQPITSGQVTFTLTPSTDSTLPGTGRFIPSTINCNINADGTLSGFVAGAVSGPCVVTRNTAITPGGTAYRICIQANFQTPGSCWYDYATTATKDISTPAPTLSTGPLNYNGVPGPPLDFAGTWSGSTAYSIGQMVVFSNVSYISLANQNLGNTPSSSPSSWSQVQPIPTIVPAPSGTQTVLQPDGTTLSVNSLNGALNPTLFAGADLGAKINAAFASCTSNCVVIIPPGTYSYSTTIHMNKITQSLMGLGASFTTMNYTGSGDAVLWQMDVFSVSKAGTLKGLTFACTAAATNCIHAGIITGSTWEDLVVKGATKSGASGILLENIADSNGTAGWTERTYMHNVHLGASGLGNTFGLTFRNTSGTNSFGYSDFDIWFNIDAHQIGINDEANTSPYHSTIVARGNIDAEPATFIKVAGIMVNDSIFIAGETGASTVSAAANDIVVTSTGQITATGSIMIANAIAGVPNNNLSPPNIAAGGIYKVGGSTDFSFPGGSNFPETQNNVTEKAALPSSIDGRYIIGGAQFGLTGRYVIEWPGNTNRYDVMTVDVACGAFEGNDCYLSYSNYSSSVGGDVITNPQIFLDRAGAVPYLTVDIGNRNGVSQDLIVTWMGSPVSTPFLFPNPALSASALVTYGLASKQSGLNITTPALSVNGTAGVTKTCTVLPTVVNGIVTGC